MDRTSTLLRGLLILGLAAAPAAAQEAKGQAPGVGTFKFLEVVDGDTLRVEVDGKSSSLRLLAIDTEEVFHEPHRQTAAEQDFVKYARASQGSASRPVKYGTPFGEAAKQFAIEFFKGVSEVEIENDDPAEKKGTYGRILSYVFAAKDGKRVHYNVEVVRMGFSPYYVKYGRSRYYDAAFKAAEKEAREAKRGIWGDWKALRCYPDYAERLKWWGGRADLLDRWRERVTKNGEAPEASRETLITLTDADADARLRAAVGKTITLMGSVNRARHPQDRPSYLLMPVKGGKDIYIELGRRLDDGGLLQREFAVVQGTMALNNNRLRLVDAKLVEPKLPTAAATPKSQGSQSAFGGGKLISLASGNYSAERALELILSKAQVSYSLAIESGDNFSRVVVLNFQKVRVDAAAHCVTRAAGLSIDVRDGVVYVSAEDPDRILRDQVSKLRLERERLILQKEIVLLRTMPSTDPQVIKGLRERLDARLAVERLGVLREQVKALEKQVATLKRRADQSAH